jgi:leucyl-tRNA synthetase
MIQEQYKNKMIPIYELLVDFELKINVQRFFHVALARLMELNNYLQKLSQDLPANKDAYVLGYVYLVQGLYPFVPHLASELWTSLEAVILKLGF